jgi:signal transduction histidine kinase/CheY-like chemotaxis protein
MDLVKNQIRTVQVKAEALASGMVLAEDLRHFKGRLILKKGTHLSPKELRLIKMWGIIEAKIELNGTGITREDKSESGKDPVIDEKAAARVRNSHHISTTNNQQNNIKINRDMQPGVRSLEPVNRFTLDTLENAARLGDFQTSINQMDSSSAILEETYKRIRSLIPIETAAFYLVNEEDSEFYLAECKPGGGEGFITGEVENYIENGTFGRAIREQRPILVSNLDLSIKILLHVLTTASRVRGMFVGVFTPGEVEVPLVSLSLMSIILLHSANALESYELYNMIKAINRDLEKTVEERTKELQRSREQLRHAQKMEALGRLAGGVVHDFNNILTAIAITSEVSLQQPNIPPRFSRNFEEILGVAERASTLVLQLLAFSKRQVIKPMLLDINEVALDIEKMLSRLIPKDIKIILEPGKNLPPIKADPGQIDQIFMNLAVNSQDALREHPDPTIDKKLIINISYVQLGDKDREVKQKIVNEKGDYIRISFSDNGVGMDEDTRQRVFEPFFTTKEEGKGTGLGLSTVYGIVQQNNGGITVESTPGKGTTFYIYWPCIQTSDRTGQKSTINGKAAGGKETILLVEDDATIKNTMVEFLTSLGYKVLTAENGKIALKKAKKYPGSLDLLLTDIIMPAMDGVKLAAVLREQRPSLKMIFTSGFITSPHPFLQSLPPGSRFIQKPYSINSITTIIRELLDEK